MKILTNIDLANNQILNVVAQVLASAPSSPAAGRFYYDSILNAMRYYNGASWIDLTSSSSDAEMLDGQLPSFYLARANHTGTQTASTISDFDTQVRTSTLNQMATATADVALGAHKLTGVADPTNPQDAATKAYVDAARQGLDVKPSVRAATTANITLSGEQTIDGVSVVSGDRVLVKAQTSGSENGIYVAASGSWTRATDADSSAKVTPGLYTFVEEGTTLADTGWICSNDGAITLNATALTFVQFSSAGVVIAGTGITKTGNVIALDSAGGYGVRKAQADVGDNSSTDLSITHNLSTRDVAVQVYNKTTPYETVFCDVERTSTSAILLRFATAPGTAQYRVVLLG